MYAITIEAPATPRTTESGDHEDENLYRRQFMVKRSIVKNILISSTSFLATMAVLIGTLIYAYRSTNVHLLIDEARSNAIIVNMAKRFRFTKSSLSCDYDNMELVEWQDGAYPPVFGNTDVVVYSARLTDTKSAEELRKSMVDSKKGKKDEKEEEGPIKCKRKRSSRKSKSLSNSKNVTVFKISNCSMDRRDEADAFVGTIAYLSRLREVPGIPTMVDLFEEDQSVYCAVTPPLLDRLDSVKFADDNSAYEAIRRVLTTVDHVHHRGFVLLNITSKTLFMTPSGPMIEPPSQPVLLSDPKSGTFSLPRGMILPKLKPPLEAGGSYHKSLDYYMTLLAFQGCSGVSEEVKSGLKKAIDLFMKVDYYEQLTQKIYSAVDLNTVLKTLNIYEVDYRSPEKPKINYTVSETKYKTKKVKIDSSTKDKDGTDDDQYDILDQQCSTPVYDHVLDMFRRQPKRSMDNFSA